MALGNGLHRLTDEAVELGEGALDAKIRDCAWPRLVAVLVGGFPEAARFAERVR